jgi:hypothetical protein
MRLVLAGNAGTRETIMLSGFTAFTWAHTLLSIAALITGAVVVKALIESRIAPLWTEAYLFTAVLTSATGFGFAGPFQPSHAFAVICLVLLFFATLGYYVFKLRGAWRWIYAVGIGVTVYLDYFVLVVQLFRKVPALHALAPTESEAPFAVAQLALLAVFSWLIVQSARKFRPATAH